MKKIILSIAVACALGLFSFNASAQTTYPGYTDSYGNATTAESNGCHFTSRADSFGNTTSRTW